MSDTEEDIYETEDSDMENEELDIERETEENLSQKETIINDLEPRPISSAGKNDNGVTLELGDVIEIYAPTNPDIHEVTALITYIDENKIKLINVATQKLHLLNITDDGRFTDETITQIALLSRDDEKGFARQNNLLVKTWVDIHFGGEFPTIITGEITNLEEDMVELTTYPELKTIYIDFAYKGIPENLPIENIVIREKPSSVLVGSLAMLKGPVGEDEPTAELGSELATIQYNDMGESVIRIPEQAIPDENIRKTLQDLYLDANSIVFGEALGELAHIVEVPEEEKRYSIETQVTDFMEEILSTVPNSQRTKRVLDNIHILMDRFKELRKLFSKFDSNENVYDAKLVGPYYKPLVETLHKFDKKLQWIIPVVGNRKKINFDSDNVDKIPENTPEDILIEKYVDGLNDFGRIQKDYYYNNVSDENLDYVNYDNKLTEWFRPFDKPYNTSKCLTTTDVLQNMDTIVDNLETLSSTVFTNAGVSIRQYVIQRYNLSSTHMVKKILKTQKIVYNVENTTSSDTMCVKSLIMLPEPVVRFSAVDLPGTNILDRTNLHHNYFMIFRLLSKNADIKQHIIENLSKEMDYDNDATIEFLRGIHEFSIDAENIDDMQYEKFLDVIIPKTRFIIRLVRKYLKYKLSFVSVVQQLEPFMVYTDSITYKEYMEIRFAIKEHITELKKSYSEKLAEFSNLKNAKYNVSPKINPVLRILSENKEFVDQFFQSYAFLHSEKNNTNLTGEETILKILQYDNGKLYMNMITSLLISLMTPNNFMDVLSRPKITDMTDMEKIKAVDCTQRYLTKKYKSVSDLQKDNNSEEVYYDEEFDDTPYSIIKKYEKEMKNLSPEIFVEFLAENLIHKHDCPSELAPQMAETIIAKRKRVTEGEYAVLEIEADKKTQYYKRIKDNWVSDASINEETFIDTNTLFCNIGKSCYKNTQNGVCEPLDDAASRMREIYNRKLLNEFDKRYEINVEELEKKLAKNMEQQLRMLGKQQVLREIQLYKANNLAYEIGGYAKNTDDLIISPYMRLRDLILGEDDFTKKQADICRFVENFCREPLVAELKENANWFYCKETNTKLFPFSIYELAGIFISGGDYSRKLDELCNRLGVLSDDGDAIVDKHSGYVLRKLEFNVEEGYDESGFRITTHDIIEQDLGTVILEAIGKKERPVFENETNQMIYNIFSKICEHVDIPIEGIYDFVMRVSGEVISKNIIKKEAYERRAAKSEKEKGKQMKPYETYKNELVIYIISSVVLVSIQTAIPSYRTKKTFPGCVRSFSGYPFDGGIEDLTGLKYIACILSKTADKSVETWNAIKGIKVETFVTRMKSIIEEYIMKRSDITELYIKKNEYLAINSESISIEEHSISKWLHFMPPIVSYQVTRSLMNVSSDFESNLIDVLRKGHKDQFTSIAVLKSKVIKYGYAVIENINKIVKTKNHILKTMTNIPFLENACCNETSMTNPYTYFNQNSEGQIQQYLISVKKLIVLLNDVKSLSFASLLYDPTFTGIIYPPTPTGQLEENIYEAVIQYCNLDNEKPIPIEMQGILSEKLPLYKKDDSIHDKIELFKRNGKNFGIETLHQILRIVYEKNIVNIENKEPFQEVESFKEIIDYLDNSNSSVFEGPLRRNIQAVIGEYKDKTLMHEPSETLRKLKNYLKNTNQKMYNIIIDFFDEHGSLSNRELAKIEDFLSHLTSWKIGRNEKLAYDEELYTITKFIQTAIYSMTKVYPSVLLSKEGFYKNVPKHWKLSDNHENDIENFINKKYTKIESFKDDEIIVELLKEINTSLLDIHMFVKNIPVYTEIIKETENNKYTFFSLFDKETTLLLHKYCFYSCIYEYIMSSDNNNLVRIYTQENMKNRRNTIIERADPANLLGSVITGDIDETTYDEDLNAQEIQIFSGNVKELKTHVSSLLLSFIDTEIDNKTTVDFSYKNIKERVNRSKEKEKRGIIRRLGNMAIDERRVENMMKNYRLGRWNVGQQKGLVQYDPDTYDRERQELFAEITEDFDSGKPDIVTEMVSDIYDLEKTSEEEANEEETRTLYDLHDLGNGDGFTDGVFYEEDRDEEDFYE